MSSAEQEIDRLRRRLSWEGRRAVMRSVNLLKVAAEEEILSNTMVE